MDAPKFVLNNHTISSASVAVSQSSGVIEIKEVIGFTVHASFTGSPVGSFVTSTSGDGLIFVPIDTKAVTASGVYTFNVPVTHAPYVRVDYTATSGTGTIDVYISGKR